jgi:hypothetical protein
MLLCLVRNFCPVTKLMTSTVLLSVPGFMVQTRVYVCNWGLVVPSYLKPLLSLTRGSYYNQSTSHTRLPRGHRLLVVFSEFTVPRK